MELMLPEPLKAALPVLERLQEHQCEAVFVGGCVRDTLLGLPVKDVDIATSARPEQVVELFERCIPTGLQHGTVTVLLGKMSYEVTTFRQESQYELHRRPESVSYITSLNEDLMRRDFTVNAMALTADGLVKDPFGGIEDLRRSLLRCVGKADDRFQEDALRMLRAVRFVGVYGFKPALQTWRALIRHRELLRYVALERVQAELDKMLSSSDPQRALYFAGASSLLAFLKEPLLPEVIQAVESAYKGIEQHGSWHGLSLLDHVDTRWAFVAIALGLSGEQVDHTLTTLKFANQRLKRIKAVVMSHEAMKQPLEMHDMQLLKQIWVRHVLQVGPQTATDWLETVRAWSEGMDRARLEPLGRLSEWMDAMKVYSVKQLCLKGDDLTRHLHRKAGPWVSIMLQKLLYAVATGTLLNDKQHLLNQAQRWDEEVFNDET